RAPPRAAGPVPPPRVPPEGGPATGAGFRKRVLYLDTAVLPEDLIGAAVDRPTIPAPALRRALHRLHLGLRRGADPLDAEAGLAMLGGRLPGRAPPGGGPPGPRAAPPARRAPRGEPRRPPG